MGRSEKRKDFLHPSYRMRMADIDRDPDSLYTFHHAGELLWPLAEELSDCDHVLEARED